MWAVIGINDLQKFYSRKPLLPTAGSGPPPRVSVRVLVCPALLWAAPALGAGKGPQPMAGEALVWLGTGLALAAATLALVSLSRWIRRWPLRDLVLVALITGMAFLLVSIPGFMTRSLASVLLGPFSFFLEGLIFKLVLFSLLGALFALVRRPGVFFLFFGLWTVAQALLNGHYSPMMLLFAASTVCIVEAALWLSGITRHSGKQTALPWLSGALVVGLAEGLSVFWSLNLIVLLFRVYLAEWFVLLQAGTEAVYAGLGLAMGLRMGGQLRAMRRPAVDHAMEQAGDSTEDNTVGGITKQSAAKPNLQSQPRPVLRHDPWPGGAAQAANGTAQAGNGAPLLEIENLSFAYPQQTDSPSEALIDNLSENQSENLLENLSLRVAPGEIVLLAGASGCGKTTLLRLVQGLLPWPRGASLRFGGQDGRGLSPRERALRSGLLFQEPALQVLRSTVEGEVAFGYQLLHGETEQQERRTAEALEMFSLGHLAARNTQTLSGGELQSTALAAIIAPGTPLLLLDEPLANLDQAGRERVLGHLRRMAGEGLGIVVAEHRLAPLLPLAQRVLWLEQGRAPWQGSPEQFRQVRDAPWQSSPEQFQRTPPVNMAGPAGADTAAGANTAAGADRAAGAGSAKPREREPLIEVRALRYSHGGAVAPTLRGVDARLLAGQIVALSGANGAGKTTLISLILGLAKPRGGTVTVRGKPAHRLSWKEKSRFFGYLPQQAELILQAATVADELAFALRCQGKPKAFIESRTAFWLERLGLGAMAGRAPQLLSRGEKQRLALGAVMIAEPQVLVLDEPFAGQDKRQIEVILNCCADYLEASPERSLLVTTHDLAGIDGFFHEEWRLEDGRNFTRKFAGDSAAAQAARADPVASAAPASPAEPAESSPHSHPAAEGGGA